MSTRLKALGLGLVAMLAMGAFGALNAAADPEDPHRGGHFVSEVNTTTIVGLESGSHTLDFTIDNANPIGCKVGTYHGHETGLTLEEVTVKPTYDECYTTNDGEPVVVDTNGCGYEFTVNTAPATEHNAVHIEGCTSGHDGKLGIVITHDNCTIRIPEQTVTGVTYTNKVNPTTGKHEITLDATVNGITAYYETGICIFLGTNHTGQMNGSVTVQGFNNEAKQVHVTAT
jgi:hypothetical protein